MPRRPRIFIGSSTGGLAYADALHAELDRRGCEPTVWNQNVFTVSKSTLENLVKKAHAVDFAALVLTPDDVLKRGDGERQVARDNVLFEAGLFMGALGPGRTFLVHSRDDDIALPSDVAGITAAKWSDRDDGNWNAALSVPAGEILAAITEVRRELTRVDTLIDCTDRVEVEEWTLEERDGGQGRLIAEKNVLRVERDNAGGSLWLWLDSRMRRLDGAETVTFSVTGEVRASGRWENMRWRFEQGPGIGGSRWTRRRSSRSSGPPAFGSRTARSRRLQAWQRSRVL
jgi:Predicted nucleotide-binding protein containing TIR-like domain